MSSSSKTAKVIMASSDDTSSTNNRLTMASIPSYMSESVSSTSPLNFAEPSWSSHVRSLIIIRNESGYGFTLSRYLMGQNDALNLLPQEPDLASDSDKVSGFKLSLSLSLFIVRRSIFVLPCEHGGLAILDTVQDYSGQLLD